MNVKWLRIWKNKVVQTAFLHALVVGGLWEFFEDFPKPIFSESLKHQALDSSIKSEGLDNILAIWTID